MHNFTSIYTQLITCRDILIIHTQVIVRCRSLMLMAMLLAFGTQYFQALSFLGGWCRPVVPLFFCQVDGIRLFTLVWRELVLLMA